MTLEPMEHDDIESIARDAVTDAIDFIDSEIAKDRIKAQRYFDGEVMSEKRKAVRGSWQPRFAMQFATSSHLWFAPSCLTTSLLSFSRGAKKRCSG